MSDNPETGSKEISMQELVQGVGRLVIKLNESVVAIDNRLEKMESGLSSMLEGSFKDVTSELTRTNELLSKLCEKDVKEEDSQEDGLLKQIEEIVSQLNGIRDDISGSGKTLMDTLSEIKEVPVGRELFSETVGELSKLVSDSAGSLEKSISEAVEESGKTGEKALSENVKLISEGLSEISEKMDSAREKVEEKLGEISKSTAEEVSSIADKVEESTDEQKQTLNEMKELLSLHSVEVQDNRVRELNRSAIVHFNNSEYDMAKKDLEEALELTEDSPELLANLAHIEASDGELEKAEEHFRKALEMDPNLEPALSGLGTVMLMSGRPGDTIDFLQKYLEEGSDASTGVMIALSRAYASQDNHQKALSILEQAEKAAPGHPELEQELAKYRS
jgi:tetratricopeptide (TPR) repeat protein